MYEKGELLAGNGVRKNGLVAHLGILIKKDYCGYSKSFINRL